MRLLSRVVLAICGSGAVLLLGAGQATAEEISLESASPTGGATLTVAPTEIRLNFAAPIDPARLTVSFDNGTQLIDLGTPRFDPIADDVAVIPIVGGVPNGAVGYSWRLVAGDGSVSRGRVEFSVNAPVSVATLPIVTTTVDPAVFSPLPPVGASTPAPTMVPTTESATTTTASEPASTTPAAAVGPPPDAGGFPALLLGLTRWIVYAALSMWVGCFLLISWLWKNAARSQRFRQWLYLTWVVLVAAAAGAVLFRSWQLRGSPGLMFGDLWRQTGGRGVLSTLVLALALGTFALDPATIVRPFGRFSAAFLTVILALSIAASRHAATERWLWLGVIAQTIHILAIAIWLGLLAGLGLLMLKEANNNDARFAVAQFTSVAPGIMVAIVTTGLFQSVRFLDGPGDLVSGGYGRWLLLKLAVIGVMLLLTRVNRERIGQRMIGRGEISKHTREQLRRALVTEFFVGTIVLATTATLVVQSNA